MWEEITKWAEDEFRSVNGQIEYLISEALRKRNKKLPGEEAGKNSTDVDKEN